MPIYKASPPGGTTIGKTSVAILSLKGSRQFATISNLHATNLVFLGFNGNRAELNKGVMIAPRQTLILSYEQVSLDQVEAIASAASTLISFQEFV